MRRVLLGGLGIALGVFVRPAAAQDFPGRPAPTDPPVRAARLGRPVAVPDAVPGHPTAPGAVIPVAGMVARGQVPPPIMLIGDPAPGVPYSPLPAVGPPGMVLGPPPGSHGPAPTVTMIRDPYAAGPGAIVGVPTGVPGDLAACPQPGLDAPLVGGAPARAPAFPALSRLLACGGGNRTWVGAEYLAWWTRSTALPVLAATGPVPAGPDDLVVTNVPILQGSFGETLHTGLRVSGGMWFTEEQRRGVDARMFFLFRNGTGFSTNSASFPVLGRPFFNLNNPVGLLTDVISTPGRSVGGIAVHLENSLWGAEVNYRRFLAGNPCARLDGLVGFRYMNFKEQLSITESGLLDPSSPLIAAGRAPFASATDTFRTENNFYGGQIGLTGEVRRGRWFVDTRASIAFGSVTQTAQISGSQQQVFASGINVPAVGGLLAQPGANIGTFTQSKFAVMPEVGVNLGYHITPNLRVFGGYNFLYLSSVLRPANVIDPFIDSARVPNFLADPGTPVAGLARPSPQFRTTDFWAQGVSFGLQWTF